MRMARLSYQQFVKQDNNITADEKYSVVVQDGEDL